EARCGMFHTPTTCQDFSSNKLGIAWCYGRPPDVPSLSPLQRGKQAKAGSFHASLWAGGRRFESSSPAGRCKKGPMKILQVWPKILSHYRGSPQAWSEPLKWHSEIGH